MKPLAIAVFSFLAGLFAPQITGISISIANLSQFDPIAVAFVSIWLIGVSLLLKKRKWGRA